MWHIYDSQGQILAHHLQAHVEQVYSNRRQSVPTHKREDTGVWGLSGLRGRARFVSVLPHPGVRVFLRASNEFSRVMRVKGTGGFEQGSRRFGLAYSG